MDEDRRFKIAYLSRPFLSDLLNGLVRVATLPEGVRVAHIDYDFPRLSIGMILSHPTFDPIPCGEQIPHIEIGVKRTEQA